MKEWKAPEKEAQKMTRDGAVSVNLVTGETTYPSDRTPEQDHSASGDTAGAAGKVVDRVELHREQAAAKKKRRKQRRTYREGEAAAGRPSSRLQFSEADQAKPELQGAIRKSDKAADRLDAAKTAVPSKLPSPQHANPLSRPIQEAGAAIHGKVREVEQENSGVQSGHLGERSFEKAVGYGNRRVQNWRAERKLKPWRDAAKAEQAAVKANADFYYRKAVAENPQLASNPISRLWQKRKLQKQYAAAYRAAGKTAQAGKTAETTAKAAKKTAQESKRTALLIGLHQHRIPVDLILFADTGAEHPHTYAYLEVMDRWLKDHGMPPIIRVYKTTRDGKRLTLEDECLQSCSLPSIAYGFKRCSLKHKIGPQEKFCNHYPPCQKAWAAGKRVVKFIGYDAGEGYRSDKVLLGDLADRKYSKWYPLMEWGWTRDDCIRQIEAAGLPQPGKSSCFFCPSMKPDEITALREQHPDLFRRALALEDNARKNLKTVKGLGRNYSWRERFGKEFCTHGNG